MPALSKEPQLDTVFRSQCQEQEGKRGSKPKVHSFTASGSQPASSFGIVLWSRRIKAATT